RTSPIRTDMTCASRVQRTLPKRRCWQKLMIPRTMPSTEMTFLLALFAGILCLIAGLLLTRFNWRSDVPPYGRHSKSFDVALNPAKYAGADVVPLIRTLNALGGILLAVAVLALIWEGLAPSAKRL